MSLINYVKVRDKKSKFLSGFLDTYKKAFAGPPYFERYDDEWIIENVWNNHIDHGCVIVAFYKGKIVGLGCCIELNAIPDDDPNVEVRDFLREKSEFDINSTCYMSELAVLPEFRSNGLGTSLICRRFQWSKENGMKSYVMRTAVLNSNSEQIYLDLGARTADFIQDVSEHADEVHSSSTQRKFLYNYL